MSGPRRLAVVEISATWPPRRGNQVRTAGLLANLGPGWRVDSYSLMIQRHDLPLPPRSVRVSDRWTDWRGRDPLLLAWCAGFNRLGHPAAWTPRILGLLPRRRLRAALAVADAVLYHPPYLVDWLLGAVPPGVPLVLDEHSIETDMYAGGGPLGSRVMAEVRRSEDLALRSADLVLVTSEADLASVRLRGARRAAVVPNGVDLERVRPVPAGERAALRRRLGLPPSGHLAVFLGSGHPPNLDAVEALEESAADFAARGITVVVAGRCALGRPRRPGLLPIGEVPVVADLLGAVDLALCPLRRGSGVSFKTLEFLAAGLPLVSTAVGVRGLGMRAGVDHVEAGPAEMAGPAAGLLAEPARAAALGARGRRIAEGFGWTAIGGRCAALLDDLVERHRSRPATVLHVAPSAELYGSDLALERTVRGHVARGGRSVVALPEAGPLLARLAAAGAEVEVVPLAVLRRRLVSPIGAAQLAVAVPLSALRLRRLARRTRAEVVHSNTCSIVSGAVAARITGLPHLWHLREHLEPLRRERVVARLVESGADLVAAVSGPTAEAIVSLRPRLAGRVRIVRDGVDLGRVEGLPSRGAVALEMGLDPGMPVVAMVARISRRKGQLLLVEAMARLRGAAGEVQLLLAGDVYRGDEGVLEELVTAVRRHGLTARVFLPGFLADPRPAFAVADIVAAPSLRPESYDLAVVEALTAGRPVVASRLGGHLETVRHGVDGLLVPAGDVGSLAEAVGSLLGDPLRRATMAAAAWRDRGRFAPEPGVAAIEALYAELQATPALDTTPRAALT